MLGRRLAAGTAVLAGHVSGLIFNASPALAIGCGQTQDVSTSGAKASWTPSCGSAGIRVEGWVKDTDADGQCAEVYAFWPVDSSKESRQVCGKGNTSRFDWTHAGTTVEVRLREVG